MSFMTRSIKSKQRKVRVMALNVDGTGTAALSGLDKHQATLTDNGVGDYTITFDEVFSAADYSVAVTPLTVGIIPQIFSKSTSAVRIKTFLESSSSGSAVAGAAAVGVLELGVEDIGINYDALGDEGNGVKVTLQVAAAAANAGNKCLVDVAGDERNITITITPDDGGQNVTVTELVALINGGSVATVTFTDVKNLLSLINAVGSGAALVFADGGAGDGVTTTLAAGVDSSSTAAGVARAAADCDFDIVIIGSEVAERF